MDHDHRPDPDGRGRSDRDTGCAAEIWSGFQIVGGSSADPALTSPTGAQNAVVLGLIMLAVCTVVNISGVRQMAVSASVGVVIEIIGVIALVLLLFFLPERGPSVVFHHEGWTGGGALLARVPRVVVDGRLRDGRFRLRRRAR